MEQVAATTTIRGTKTHKRLTGTTGSSQQPAPLMLSSLRVMTEPYLLHAGYRPQIVDMPMGPICYPAVMPAACGHPSRTKGAPHIGKPAQLHG